MKGRRAIVVPDSFNELLDGIEQQREQRLREAQEKQQAAARQAELECQERQQAGISYARKIFSWVEAFGENPTGRRLITVGEWPGLDGIFIFTDKVPGERERSLGIGKRGLWWMGFGCGAREEYVVSPDQLAAEVGASVLKAAWRSIESGAVWTCIQERMKRRKGK